MKSSVGSCRRGPSALRGAGGAGTPARAPPWPTLSAHAAPFGVLNRNGGAPKRATARRHQSAEYPPDRGASGVPVVLGGQGGHRRCPPAAYARYLLRAPVRRGPLSGGCLLRLSGSRGQAPPAGLRSIMDQSRSTDPNRPDSTALLAKLLGRNRLKRGRGHFCPGTPAAATAGVTGAISPPSPSAHYSTP